eukprot:TRINITY_DN81081_c0_g1_i1.p1 TRINITY_DN81081_c0_g1~~TRINITY_DN81081_c0_g1_i1.p1  ORF type:complete len:1108 (-),score=219.25 TRINITY_DN81081_c0_g1_i1:11-3334(-)
MQAVADAGRSRTQEQQRWPMRLRMPVPVARPATELSSRRSSHSSASSEPPTAPLSWAPMSGSRRSSLEREQLGAAVQSTSRTPSDAPAPSEDLWAMPDNTSDAAFSNQPSKQLGVVASDCAGASAARMQKRRDSKGLGAVAGGLCLIEKIGHELKRIARVLDTPHVQTPAAPAFGKRGPEDLRAHALDAANAAAALQRSLDEAYSSRMLLASSWEPLEPPPSTLQPPLQVHSDHWEASAKSLDTELPSLPLGPFARAQFSSPGPMLQQAEAASSPSEKTEASSPGYSICHLGRRAVLPPPPERLAVHGASAYPAAPELTRASLKFQGDLSAGPRPGQIRRASSTPAACNSSEASGNQSFSFACCSSADAPGNAWRPQLLRQQAEQMQRPPPQQLQSRHFLPEESEGMRMACSSAGTFTGRAVSSTAPVPNSGASSSSVQDPMLFPPPRSASQSAAAIRGPRRRQLPGRPWQTVLSEAMRSSTSSSGQAGRKESKVWKEEERHGSDTLDATAQSLSGLLLLAKEAQELVSPPARAGKLQVSRLPAPPQRSEQRTVEDVDRKMRPPSPLDSACRSRGDVRTSVSQGHFAQALAGAVEASDAADMAPASTTLEAVLAAASGGPGSLQAALAEAARKSATTEDTSPMSPRRPVSTPEPPWGGHSWAPEPPWGWREADADPGQKVASPPPLVEARRARSDAFEVEVEARGSPSSWIAGASPRDAQVSRQGSHVEEGSQASLEHHRQHHEHRRHRHSRREEGSQSRRSSRSGHTFDDCGSRRSSRSSRSGVGLEAADIPEADAQSAVSSVAPASTSDGHHRHRRRRHSHREDDETGSRSGASERSHRSRRRRGHDEHEEGESSRSHHRRHRRSEEDGGSSNGHRRRHHRREEDDTAGSNRKSHHRTEEDRGSSHGHHRRRRRHDEESERTEAPERRRLDGIREESGSGGTSPAKTSHQQETEIRRGTDGCKNSADGGSPLKQSFFSESEGSDHAPAEPVPAERKAKPPLPSSPCRHNEFANPAKGSVSSGSSSVTLTTAVPSSPGKSSSTTASIKLRPQGKAKEPVRPREQDLVSAAERRWQEEVDNIRRQAKEYSERSRSGVLQLSERLLSG